MGNSESTEGQLPQKSDQALVSFCKDNLTNSVLDALIKPNVDNEIVAIRAGENINKIIRKNIIPIKKNAVVRLQIDLKKKKKNMTVQNLFQKILLGPF